MQRIDPLNSKPKRLMLVLDAARYAFVVEKAEACLMSTTEFLRELVYDDHSKPKNLVEIDRPGVKENRINLILPDIFHESIDKKINASKATKASYMRALIDKAIGD
jgi:hypothetical protein